MLSRIRRKNKGFTLIELMIVVAIIGILAAIAIPNFMNYQCKAKQSEAKSNLGNIRTAEEAYFAEHDVYANVLSDTGFATKGNARYTYGVTGDSVGFLATATATLNNSNDVWQIDQAGALSNTSNACQ